MIRPFHTLPDVSAIDMLRANMHRLFARQRCILSRWRGVAPSRWSCSGEAEVTRGASFVASPAWTWKRASV